MKAEQIFHRCQREIVEHNLVVVLQLQVDLLHLVWDHLPDLTTYGDPLDAGLHYLRITEVLFLIKASLIIH